MRKAWLAIEGGGTKTRILLVKPNGTLLAQHIGPSASPLYINPQEYEQTLTSMLLKTRETSKKHHVDISAVALAAPMDVDLVRNVVHRLWGTVTVVRFRESDLALGFYGLSYGCAIIAGTGSSCYVHAPDNSVHLAGGLGPQFGDEGSAYWIGRETISRILRESRFENVREPLTERMLAHFRISSPYDILAFTRGNGFIAAPRVAAFAREVFALARKGNKSALEMCSRAGKALGLLAAEAIQRAKMGQTPIPVVCAGGVFHAGELLTTYIQTTLKSHGISFIWYPPVIEPTPGVFRALKSHLNQGDSYVSG